MRITVKSRIIATMAAAFFIAIAVGTFGLWSLERTQADLSSMYRDQLMPIVHLGEVRNLIFLDRTALNQALLAGTSDAAAAADDRIKTHMAEMGKHWSAYYPALVNSDIEMSQDKTFIAKRLQTRDLIAQELKLLNSDQHEKASDFMLHSVESSFDEETSLIGKIVNENVRQAQQASADSSARGHRTVIITLLVLVVAALLVLFSGFALTRAVMKPLLQARGLAERISKGELNQALVVTGHDELSDTLRALSQMDTQLTAIVAKVRDNASDVMHSARDISAGNDDLSSRTQEQASSLEETAASMEEMTATVKQNAEGAGQAQNIATSLRSDAIAGRKIAVDASSAMELITEASRSISEIAVLIDEIAFQTNLLALNAAVEAARAGDQGRGFAVVATEVRSLAQRSASAAKSIKSLINDTVERVSVGAELVRKAGHSLETIQTGATRVCDIVSEIAAASVQQSSGIEQVNDAVTALDQVTQQNAALVEEASAASRQALELTQELVQQMAFFKIAGIAEEAASRIKVRAVEKVARTNTNEPAHRLQPVKLVLDTANEW